MKNKRRISIMEKSKKELRAEGIEEIEENKVEPEGQSLKVRDYIDMAKELTGLVRENYIVGFQLGLSIFEGNSKIMGNQIEKWVTVQEEYASLVKGLFDKLTNQVVSFSGSNSKFVIAPVERMLSLQGGYFSVLINTSDRFMKETTRLMKNGIEGVFSSFGD